MKTERTASGLTRRKVLFPIRLSRTKANSESRSRTNSSSINKPQQSDFWDRLSDLFTPTRRKFMGCVGSIIGWLSGARVPLQALSKPTAVIKLIAGTKIVARDFPINHWWQETTTTGGVLYDAIKARLKKTLPDVDPNQIISTISNALPIGYWWASDLYFKNVPREKLYGVQDSIRLSDIRARQKIETHSKDWYYHGWDDYLKEWQEGKITFPEQCTPYTPFDILPDWQFSFICDNVERELLPVLKEVVEPMIPEVLRLYEAAQIVAKDRKDTPRNKDHNELKEKAVKHIAKEQEQIRQNIDQLQTWQEEGFELERIPGDIVDWNEIFTKRIEELNIQLKNLERQKLKLTTRLPLETTSVAA